MTNELPLFARIEESISRQWVKQVLAANYRQILLHQVYLIKK